VLLGRRFAAVRCALATVTLGRPRYSDLVDFLRADDFPCEASSQLLRSAHLRTTERRTTR
jgi:hypothetical protein